MVSRPSATCAVAYNDGVHSWPWQPLQRLPIPFSAASAKEKGGRRRRRRWKAILAQKSSSGVAFIIDSIPFVFAPTEAKPISSCASHKTRLLCQLPPRSTDLSQLLSKLCLFGASVNEREQEQRASRQRDQSHQTSSILTLELYRRFKFCLLFAPQKLSNWPSKTKFKLQIA